MNEQIKYIAGQLEQNISSDILRFSEFLDFILAHFSKPIDQIQHISTPKKTYSLLSRQTWQQYHLIAEKLARIKIIEHTENFKLVLNQAYKNYFCGKENINVSENTHLSQHSAAEITLEKIKKIILDVTNPNNTLAEIQELAFNNTPKKKPAGGVPVLRFTQEETEFTPDKPDRWPLKSTPEISCFSDFFLALLFKIFSKNIDEKLDSAEKKLSPFNSPEKSRVSSHKTDQLETEQIIEIPTTTTPITEVKQEVKQNEAFDNRLLHHIMALENLNQSLNNLAESPHKKSLLKLAKEHKNAFNETLIAVKQHGFNILIHPEDFLEQKKNNVIQEIISRADKLFKENLIKKLMQITEFRNTDVSFNSPGSLEEILSFCKMQKIELLKLYPPNALPIKQIDQVILTIFDYYSPNAVCRNAFGLLNPRLYLNSGSADNKLFTDHKALINYIQTLMANKKSALRKKYLDWINQYNAKRKSLPSKARDFFLLQKIKRKVRIQHSQDFIGFINNILQDSANFELAYYYNLFIILNFSLINSSEEEKQTALSAIEKYDKPLFKKIRFILNIPEEDSALKKIYLKISSDLKTLFNRHQGQILLSAPENNAYHETLNKNQFYYQMNIHENYKIKLAADKNYAQSFKAWHRLAWNALENALRFSSEIIKADRMKKINNLTHYLIGCKEKEDYIYLLDSIVQELRSGAALPHNADAGLLKTFKYSETLRYRQTLQELAFSIVEKHMLSDKGLHLDFNLQELEEIHLCVNEAVKEYEGEFFIERLKKALPQKIAYLTGRTLEKSKPYVKNCRAHTSAKSPKENNKKENRKTFERSLIGSMQALFISGIAGSSGLLALSKGSVSKGTAVISAAVKKIPVINAAAVCLQSPADVIDQQLQLDKARTLNNLAAELSFDKALQQLAVRLPENLGLLFDEEPLNKIEPESVPRFAEFCFKQIESALYEKKLLLKYNENDEIDIEDLQRQLIKFIFTQNRHHFIPRVNHYHLHSEQTIFSKRNWQDFIENVSFKLANKTVYATKNAVLKTGYLYGCIDIPEKLTNIIDENFLSDPYLLRRPLSKISTKNSSQAVSISCKSLVKRGEEPIDSQRIRKENFSFYSTMFGQKFKNKLHNSLNPAQPNLSP